MHAHVTLKEGIPPLKPFQSVSKRGQGLLPGPSGRYGYGSTTLSEQTKAQKQDEATPTGAPSQMRAETPSSTKPRQQG